MVLSLESREGAIVEGTGEPFLHVQSAMSLSLPPTCGLGPDVPCGRGFWMHARECVCVCVCTRACMGRVHGCSCVSENVCTRVLRGTQILTSPDWGLYSFEAPKAKRWGLRLK